MLLLSRTYSSDVSTTRVVVVHPSVRAATGTMSYFWLMDSGAARGLNEFE